MSRDLEHEQTLLWPLKWSYTILVDNYLLNYFFAEIKYITFPWYWVYGTSNSRGGTTILKVGGVNKFC